MKNINKLTKKRENAISRLFKTNQQNKYNNMYFNVNGYNFMTNTFMIIQLNEENDLNKNLTSDKSLESFMKNYDISKKDFSNMIEIDLNTSIDMNKENCQKKYRTTYFNEYDKCYSFNKRFIKITNDILNKPKFYKEKENEQILYAKDQNNNYALILAVRGL